MKALIEKMLQTEINGRVWSYDDFLNWVDELSSAGQTSGSKQTAALVGFTALNLIRMRRIGKTLEIKKSPQAKMSAMTKPQFWLLITEAWCGDSAQSLPVIAELASISGDKIQLGIILRDENLHIMDRYLTNGGRSIPKLIAFDHSGNELFQWGPRPASAHEMYLHWKENQETQTHAEFEKELHTWYARNKTEEIQEELLGLIS